VTGSWIGLFLVFISLIAQFFVAIAPPFTSELGSAEDFFKAYLALPVVLLFWAIGYLWKRQGFLKLDQIDLDTGAREHDWERINAHREQMKTWPLWRRIFTAIF
jgi:yeast amino acid transporter